eukprot:12129311-Karenia_brevis.AAC.1
MLHNKPVHGAIDNSAVVDKGTKLIHNLQLRHDYQPTTPYNLQTDGDLWEIAHHALVTRGPHSVKLTKVKGHAAFDQCTMQALRDHRIPVSYTHLTLPTICSV